MDFSTLGTTEWLIIAGVVLLLIILIVVVLAMRRRRRTSLSQRYGPEYERTVRAAGGERAARHDLADREKEREGLQLRDLDDRQRREFSQRLARLQYRFAEDPSGAVYESGRVAADALQARGYPITQDRDRALGLLAVDHPKEAQPLRTAIDGSYGKDAGQLRETFIGVRDSLREVVGIHYSLDDGAGGRGPSGPAASKGAGTASLAPGRSGDTSGRPSGTAPGGERDRPRDASSSADETRDDTGRHESGRDTAGRHRAPDAGDRGTDDSSATGSSSPDRTVRLDDPADRDAGDAPSRPIGTVPPAPSESERSSRG